MHRFVLSALLLAGCTGNDNFGFSGFDMAEYFEFDGERTWEFVSTDQTLPYLLVGVLDTESESANEGVSKIFTVNFHKDCLREEDCVEEEFVRSWRWSSEGTNGTLLWGYQLAGEEPVTFDPPVKITKSDMLRDEQVTTETGGTTWTSTFVAIEECPVQWNVEWDECIKLEVDDGDGDPSKGSPVSGEFWVVAGFNIVAFDTPDQEGRWELKRHIYEAL